MAKAESQGVVLTLTAAEAQYLADVLYWATDFSNSPHGKLAQEIYTTLEDAGYGESGELPSNARG